MRWAIIMAACVACGDEPQAELKPEGESEDSGRSDTSEPDTGPELPANDTGTSDDTGEPPGPETVAVSVSAEPVECESPGLRESRGPMREYNGGRDWNEQNGTANLWSLFGGAGLAIADFNGDGVLDIFLPNANGDQLYMGRPDFKFDDETADRLPPESDVGVGATPVDIDGDGDLDIFVAVYLNPNRVLINDGNGFFTDSGGDWLAGQTRVSQGSSWADIDGDGDLDAYIANYGNWDEGWLIASPTSPTVEYGDLLWINEGDGGFTNADERLGSMNPAGAFTFASGFWDIDDDGDADLLAVNDFRYEYDWAEPVRLLTNEEGHFFDPDPEVGLDLEVEGMGVAVGEINGDGQLDVAVQAWSTHLMLSDGMGRYVESAASRGVTTRSNQEVGWGVALADMNNDGLLDMPVSFGLLPPDEVSMGPMPEIVIGDVLNMNQVRQPDALYVQESSGQFSEVGESWGLDHDGVSRGFLTVDLNRDGFLDVVARDLMGPTRIHMSRCDDSAWLSIALKQPGSNPFAVGSKITVTSNDRQQVRYIQAGSTGIASGGPPVAHVGLADAESVERIDVRWADGAVSVVENVATRARLVIERD